MSELKIKGGIKLINDVKVISDKFSVREFIITIEDPKYPQDIIFQTVNDKMSILDNIKRGDAVEVSFKMRGREYGGRYYNTLDAWNVQPINHKSQQASTQPIELDDDLPF